MFKVGEKVICDCIVDVYFKNEIVKIIEIGETTGFVKNVIYLVESPSKERKWFGGVWLKKIKSPIEKITIIYHGGLKHHYPLIKMPDGIKKVLIECENGETTEIEGA